MTDHDVQEFVTRFAAAWASRDGEAFLALWHPDGMLQSPLYDRPVAGKEFGRLTDFVREAAPDLIWQLLDWTARGDVVVIEWQDHADRDRAPAGHARCRQVPLAGRAHPRGACLYRHRSVARAETRRTARAAGPARLVIDRWRAAQAAAASFQGEISSQVLW